MSAPAAMSASRTVVAAGGPVQRRLRVRTFEAGLRVGPGGHQGRDHLGAHGEVTGPVGRDVQQTARALAVLTLLGDARGGETGVVREQPPEAGQIPGPDRLRDGDGQRVLRCQRLQSGLPLHARPRETAGPFSRATLRPPTKACAIAVKPDTRMTCPDATPGVASG
jgi:hypothetical protein